MQTIHKVRNGGQTVNPNIIDVLYIGDKPYGKRGGTSGTVQNGEIVAMGAGCKYLINAYSDNDLLDYVMMTGRTLCWDDLDGVRRIKPKVLWKLYEQQAN